MKPRRPPWRVRLRLHIDSLDRYHAGAVLVLVAGILEGLLAAATIGPAWFWAGFLGGAVSMFVLVALIHPARD